MLEEQHLVVQEERGEREGLPVAGAVEVVLVGGLALHDEQAAVERGEAARETVPAVLDHQAAVRVRRHQRQPAVTV